jgi:hypothetical protein
MFAMIMKTHLWEQKNSSFKNQAKCVHMYANTKMIPVETIQEMKGGEGGRKKNCRGWIHVWYNWYIVRTCVNATMYPNTTQQ